MVKQDDGIVGAVWPNVGTGQESHCQEDGGEQFSHGEDSVWLNNGIKRADKLTHFRAKQEENHPIPEE